MSRKEDLERLMRSTEKEIELKQNELKDYQKEYALILAEEAGKESLTKFEVELKRRQTKLESIGEEIQNLSVVYLTAKDSEKKEISDRLTALYAEESEEQKAIESLNATIAGCKGDLEVNKKFRQNHFYKIMTGEEPDEQQPH